MEYILISLKHGNGKRPVFWRANNCGYTTSPFAAGIYTEEQVKSEPNYYNNGEFTIAVPLTDEALWSIGLKYTYDQEKLMSFFEKNKSKLSSND